MLNMVVGFSWDVSLWFLKFSREEAAFLEVVDKAWA